MRIKLIEAVLLGSAIWLAAALPAAAATEVKVMGFGGSSNWPLFVAQEKGFFDKNGLDVKLLRAPDSTTQLLSLVDGKIDIAMTAIDNIVAYQEGQGDVPVKGTPDLFAFLGVNNGGRFNLIVAPEIKRYADLKGKDLAVDAVTSGYALVLQEMLRQGGLKPGDYKLVSVGGSRQRWEAVRDKKVAGSLLNAPYDATAEAAGFKRLANSGDHIKRYQGSVGATRRAWAAANENTLVGYVRAYIAASDWLYDPANKGEAKAILIKRQERMTPEEAERSYNELLGASGTFSRKAAMDIEGVRTVLKLRSEFAQPKKKLTDPNRYYDPKYYDKALGGS